MVGHIILAQKYTYNYSTFFKQSAPFIFQQIEYDCIKKPISENHYVQLESKPRKKFDSVTSSKYNNARIVQKVHGLLILETNIVTQFCHTSHQPIEKKATGSIALVFNEGNFVAEKNNAIYRNIFYTQQHIDNDVLHSSNFFFQKKGVTTIKYCFRKYRFFLVSRRCRTDVF